MQPDFIIGGAPRSGTTFLCHALVQHRRVFLAEPFIPEPKVLVSPGLSAADCAGRYAELFAAAAPGDLTGEKTSYYLESRVAFDYIERFLPRVKMIFLVREPVARAWSNYRWTRRNGLESLDFDEAIAREPTRPDPMPPDKAYVRPHDYLSRGAYAEPARRYLEALGADNVLFALYETLITQPTETLDRIQSFLGLETEPLSVDAGTRINAAGDPSERLDADLEAKLRQQMQPDVARFSALTGLDTSAWGY